MWSPILRDVPLEKWGGVGWNFFSQQEFFSRPLPLQDFLAVKSPARLFFCGRRGEFYCHNLNIDTRHNLIAWNRFQRNIFIFHTVVLFYCENYTPGET